MAFDRTRSPLIFGEALFDCFPDGSQVLGGAPFNVAWHLQGFSTAPCFVSRVGSDALGERIVAAMTDHGMDLSGLQRDPDHATGLVQVSLTGGEPSYDIVSDRAYDHIDAGVLPEVPPGALLYHGTLALRQPTSAAALAALCAEGDPAVFIDVNLRAPWWDTTLVIALLERARWVKLNADELALLAPAGDNVEARARALCERHQLDLLFVTLGAQGALAMAADGQVERVAPGGAVEVVDAVGAGDGFASVLILGLLRDWPLALTLARAQAFAQAIVGRRGATVSDPGFYADWLAQWAS